MNNEVLEQLKQEYNKALKRMQDIGEIIANCADIDTSHCGQDADMDDACCQARNHNQPEGYTYKDLLGMEVIGIGGIASTCAHCSDDVDCVKVELVGGTCMCLRKPQQREDVEPDKASKSWEDVYRENMELVRRHSIEQSEANQRLLKALQKQKAVISFDEEEGNVMDDIKEKAEDFLNYLDSILNTGEQ